MNLEGFRASFTVDGRRAMFVPWTIKERAVKWFPLLDDEQIRHALELMEGIFPFPRDMHFSKRIAWLNRVNAIGINLDIPPDIREDLEQAQVFLATLRMMMIARQRLAKLQLGMRVNVNGRIGTVTRLDWKKLYAVIRFGEFCHELRVVYVEDIKRSALKSRE